MLEESKQDIYQRITALTRVDATICKLLVSACIVIPDEEFSTDLLKRIRSHIALTEEPENMYTVDYYLDYVKDLVELSDGFSDLSPIAALHESAKDTYEVLLYNRATLYGVLQELFRVDSVEAMRENYWKN